MSLRNNYIFLNFCHHSFENLHAVLVKLFFLVLNLKCRASFRIVLESLSLKPTRIINNIVYFSNNNVTVTSYTEINCSYLKEFSLQINILFA